jgi:hypothetical protein
MTQEFVTVAGKRFHHIWLRDNCLCNDCRDPFNFQKKFDITDYKFPLEPKSIELGDGNLKIVWEEGGAGHKSVYPIEWLLEHSYDHADGQDSPAHEVVAMRNHNRVLWDSDYLNSNPVSKFSFKSADPQDWINHIVMHGFAVLCDVEDVIDLIRVVGPVRPTETGKVYDVGILPANYGLSQTHHPLLPHNDYEGFMHTANLLQFLHCVENKAKGGESILVDGFKVAEHMRTEQPEMFKMLSQTPAQFEKFDAGSGLFNRRTRTVIKTNSRGEIREVSFNNSHAWQWDIPFEQMTAYYAAYCAWFKLLKDQRFHYRFRLEPGDCYVVHGCRVLHSREAFVPNSGKRHMITAFTEADYLFGRRNYNAFKHHYLSTDAIEQLEPKLKEFRFTNKTQSTSGACNTANKPPNFNNQMSQILV